MKPNQSATTRSTVHVVGGGIAGLVAAVTAAEGGAPVVLHEAGQRVGGRAQSGEGAFGVNLGPHILLTDGALHRWLHERSLLPRLLRPRVAGSVVIDGGTHRTPAVGFAVRTISVLRGDAPIDETFESWAAARLPADEAALLSRWAGLATFHHDPGSLSARFVAERLRRNGRADRIRSVAGGWSSVIDAIAKRARALGVHIVVGEPMTAAGLPTDGPVIVATGLPMASGLLGERLDWTGARTALLDLALRRTDGRRPPIAVDVSRDLSTCCFIDRVTATDPGLAPADVDLLQAQLGIATETGASEGTRRIERSLDGSFPKWRERELWRRELVVENASGAVDLPGTSWRDRPAIDRGDGCFLAGDMVAAPGVLSEVAVNSAVRAAQLALEDRRQRAFAPGWPSVQLDPASRVELLAGSLPVASVRTVIIDDRIEDAWDIEPQAETEPYFQLRTGRFHTVAIGASPAPESSATEVRVMVGTRFKAKWLNALLAWRTRRELRRHVATQARVPTVL